MTEMAHLTFELPERICPVCGPHHFGTLTLRAYPGLEVAGEYCLRCYARWIAAHVPKVADAKQKARTPDARTGRCSRCNEPEPYHLRNCDHYEFGQTAREP